MLMRRRDDDGGSGDDAAVAVALYTLLVLVACKCNEFVSVNIMRNDSFNIKFYL